MHWHIIYTSSNQIVLAATSKKRVITAIEDMTGYNWDDLKKFGHVCKPMDVDVYEPGDVLPDPTTLFKNSE